MRFRVFAFVCLLLTCATHVLASEHWRADLRVLATKLPELHRNPFFALHERTFREELDTLHEAIPELRDAQVALRMMKLVASIGDGHTALEIGAWTDPAAGTLSLATGGEARTVQVEAVTAKTTWFERSVPTPYWHTGTTGWPEKRDEFQYPVRA